MEESSHKELNQIKEINQKFFWKKVMLFNSKLQKIQIL